MICLAAIALGASMLAAQTTSTGPYGIEFVQIPTGEFMMGCSAGDSECWDDESPAHRVRITRGFQIGKYEVTQEQWQAVMGSNPSRFQGAKLPVEQVSWDDIQGFLQRLNGRNDGYRYRLPTEAEWEYAARAGSADKYAGAGALGDAAWYSGDSTKPVGGKRPNAWGLYDTLGNVWEWCQDWYGETYYNNSPVENPTGPSSGQYRILRGGSWDSGARDERVSSRGWIGPGIRGASLGFRCVREGAEATPCAGPAITTQPAGRVIAAGATGELTVTASGSAPLTYQWYEGARGNTGKPVGTNSATFRTPALTAATTYWVRVTNSCGQVDSAAATVSVTAVTGPNIEFVQIQPGEFTMGCSAGDSECWDDESPAHRVRITKGFQIGKYEVTQEQWQAVMGSNPSRFPGITLPVDQVSWDDVQAFLQRLNGRNDGYRYRLPTEAEWEYAARAGSADKYAGAGALGDAAWYSGDSTKPVGGKRPNAWGLYDTLGNVWEWCQDWYGETYYASSPGENPTGPSSGQYRILRGGSWDSGARDERVSYRGWIGPGIRGASLGFRCVREGAAVSCVGPAITGQPAGQTIAAGGTADLTVTATGSAPLAYQWYEGAAGITAKPVGTNSAAFRTPALTAATTYWVRVTNTCGQANSAAATVSVTAAPLPNLVLDQSALVFRLTAGDRAAGLPVKLSSSGADVPFAATVSTNAGGNWLSVSPGSGSTPATLSIAADASNLAEGTYTGAVSVAASGAANSPQRVQVSAIVAAPPPAVLSAVPEDLSFQYLRDRQRPAAQALRISSSAGTAEFTARVEAKTPAGGRWLELDPVRGRTPGVIQASIVPVGLQPGIYSADIVVRAGEVEKRVPVQLEVVPTIDSRLETDTRQLTFESALDAAPVSRQLTIQNPGYDYLEFSVVTETDPPGGWLKVSQREGAADADRPAMIVVSADPAGLSPGAYTGRVVISSSQSQIEVPVAFAVSGSQQRLLLSQTELNFQMLRGGTPPRQLLEVLNAGQGGLGWQARVETMRGGNWLSLTSAAGEVAGGLTGLASVGVEVRAQSLEPGDYDGRIVFESPGSGRQDVVVRLQVLRPDGASPPWTMPTGSAFVSRDGRVAPAFAEISVFLPGGKAGDRFNVSVLYDPATNPPGTPEWLRAPASGTLDQVAGGIRLGTLRLEASAAGLRPGDYYRAAVMVMLPGKNPRIVSVLLALAPSGAGPSAAGARIADGCRPTRFLPLFTSLEENFLVPFGGAASMDLVVVDDCGNPVSAGTAGSTFSSRDRPLDLVPLGGGRWRASWVVRQASQSSVRVNVMAVDPAVDMPAGKPLALNGYSRGSTEAPVLSSGSPVLAPDGGRQLAAAPGSWIVIRGTRLAAEEIVAAEGELPVQLGATIAWLGGQAMKLRRVSPEEIQAVLPDDLPVNASLPLVVQFGDRLSAPEPLLIASSWPVVLSAVAQGDGLVVVECTGLGQVGAVVEIDGAPARVESVETVGAGVERLVVRARGALSGDVVVNAGRRSRPARIQAR